MMSSSGSALASAAWRSPPPTSRNGSTASEGRALRSRREELPPRSASRSCRRSRQPLPRLRARRSPPPRTGTRGGGSS